MNKIASTETALPGTDEERARLEIVLTAALLILSDDGVLRVRALDWTTGYHYGVTPADVEAEVETLSGFGNTVLHVAWGEYSPISGESSVLAR
jgi:hypothetical protein